MTKRFKLLFAAALVAFGLGAQSVERPVLSAYTIELGIAHPTDSYLSPLHFSGVAGALSYERMQAMAFMPEKWVMRIDGRLNLSHTFNNPARNTLMWSLGGEANWGMMWRKALPQGFTLAVGGYTGLEIGVDYLARNSNNPVAVNAAWTLGPTAMAVWNHRFGRLPICFRYIGRMPLTGIFFAPQYDELYYEIYLGNRHGLVHGAWPGNFFKLDNLLTADLRFGRTIVRVGYRFAAASSKANNIVTRNFEHTAVVGFANEWVSLPLRSGNIEKARIISTLY